MESRNRVAARKEKVRDATRTCCELNWGLLETRKVIGTDRESEAGVHGSCMVVELPSRGKVVEPLLEVVPKDRIAII